MNDAFVRRAERSAASRGNGSSRKLGGPIRGVDPHLGGIGSALVDARLAVDGAEQADRTVGVSDDPRKR